MSTVAATMSGSAPESCEVAGKKSIVLVSPATGTSWFIGWLFTIGFADLGWWKGLLGLVIWPYYLGDLLR